MTSMLTPALAEASNRSFHPLVSTLSRHVCRYTGILERKKTYQFPVLTGSTRSLSKYQIEEAVGDWSSN